MRIYCIIPKGTGATDIYIKFKVKFLKRVYTDIDRSVNKMISVDIKYPGSQQGYQTEMHLQQKRTTFSFKTSSFLVFEKN